MSARRSGFGLVIVILAVVAIVWFAMSDRLSPQNSQEPALAVATSAPVSAVSAAAPVVAADRGIHKSKPESIWRKPIDIVADDGTAGVPQRYQFAGVERVQTGLNFEDWMAQFPVADQKLLRAFDQQFYGVYKNRTPDQIAWMAAQGYPMPEDILAAQMMGAPELRDLSRQGNIKATFLLGNRELTEIARQMQSEGKSYNDVLEGDPQLLRDSQDLTIAMLKSDSPYRAILAARQEEVIHGQLSDSTDMGVISALYFADILGDSGVDKMIKSFINAAPNAQVRQQRVTVDGALASLYMRLKLQHTAIPPYGIGCMKLFCSMDPYPNWNPGRDN